MPVTVTTGNPYYIRGSFGYFKGSLTDIDSQASVSCYFQYRIKPATTWHNTSADMEVLNSVGEFHTTQILLLENSSYEVRAVATWDGQYAYGDTLEFRSALFREGSKEDFERGDLDSVEISEDALILEGSGDPTEYSSTGNRRIPYLITDTAMDLAWTAISPTNTTLVVNAQVQGTSEIIDEAIGTYNYQYALEFDGANDYIEFPRLLDSTTWTVEITFLPYNYSGDKTIFQQYPGSSPSGRFICSQRGATIDIFQNGSWTTGSINISSSSWIHLAVACDNGQLITYINGVADISRSNFLIPDNTFFRMGGTWNYFKGLQAELRVWNINRSQQEIIDNANIRFSGDETGLIAYCPVNENAGSTIADLTGNNNGVISGATWRKRTYKSTQWIHSMTAVKLDGTAITDYSTNDKEIVIDLPPNIAKPQITISYTAINEPVDSDPEIQELDLDNPTGGTFKLKGTGNAIIDDPEIQELDLDSPTGGTFKLGDGSTWTADIAYDATAATIETALEGLYGAGNVTVTLKTAFYNYLSGQSSSSLGWSGGGSGYNNTGGETDPCSGLVNFEAALLHAHGEGGRLATKDEMLNDATGGTGCGYDANLIWTCTKGDDDSEHWAAPGLSTGAEAGNEQIFNNLQTTYVRMVADNDLSRTDPVQLTDLVIAEALAMAPNNFIEWAFEITFDPSIGTSNLTADFTGLTYG